MAAGTKISALSAGGAIQPTDKMVIARAGGNASVLGSAISTPGKQTLWIPGGAMLPSITNGAAVTQLETSSNKQNYKVLDFDATVQEHAHFNIALPKAWDLSSVTFEVFWSSTATDTDGIAWAVQGVALSDNEAIDAAWGTAIVVTDSAQSAAGELYKSAESAAVTIAGSPADGDWIAFRLYRDVADVFDTMSEDGRLLGIKLHFTTNASNDA